MADRQTYNSTSTPPVSGPNFMDNVAEKLKLLFDTMALVALTVTNSGNDYTITVDPVLDADVTAGMAFHIRPNQLNGPGGVRVRVTADNPYYDVVKADGTAFGAGEWSDAVLYHCVFFDGKFYVVSRFPAEASGQVPTHEVFNSSGTWNKPVGYSDDAMVRVELWSGGQSGAANSNANSRIGGRGGSYIFYDFRLGDLNDTVAVTIGAGGTGVTGNSQGDHGGISAFGAYIETATSAVTGWDGIGQIGPIGSIGQAGGTFGSEGNGIGGSTIIVGPGGGAGGTTGAVGGNVMLTEALGGTGSTGSSSPAAIPGSQPGAGGGGSINTGTSGAGGPGRVIVHVIP